MVVIGSSGILAPGRMRWLRTLGWMLALAVAVIVAFNLATGAVLRLTALAAGAEFATRDAASATYKLVAAIGGAMAMLALYWAAVRTVERRPLTELGIRRLPADLLAGSAVGAAVITLIVAALWLFGWAAIDSRPVDGVALALRDSIRSGIVEELLLRLVIFRLLWRAIGVWSALALSALLFGALHLANPGSSLFAAVALASGEGIGIGLYLITGRIWASIAMHAAWNFTQGWVFGAAVSGTTDIAGGPLALRPAAGVPEYLSGGGFGPEASIAAMIVSFAASAAILWRAWRLGCFAAEEEAVNGAGQTNGYSATSS